MSTEGVVTINERYNHELGGWQLVEDSQHRVVAQFEDGDLAWIEPDAGMLVMTAERSECAAIPLEVLHDLMESLGLE